MIRQTTQNRNMMSIEQIAERLSVSTKTVRRWIDRRELHVHRMARVIRISEEDLQSLLNRHRE